MWARTRLRRGGFVRVEAQRGGGRIASGGVLAAPPSHHASKLLRMDIVTNRHNQCCGADFFRVGFAFSWYRMFQSGFTSDVDPDPHNRRPGPAWRIRIQEIKNRRTWAKNLNLNMFLIFSLRFVSSIQLNTLKTTKQNLYFQVNFINFRQLLICIQIRITTHADPHHWALQNLFNSATKSIELGGISHLEEGRWL